MKVLITGAAGFIGSQLAYYFWNNGADLVLIDNYSFGRVDNLVFPKHSFSDDIYHMDIRDKKGIADILKTGDVDYIYNMAGIAPLPDCQQDPVEAFSVNLGGLANLLENGRKYGFKKLIQASTNAIYENEIHFPTKESASVYPTLIYPTTKFCAERLAQSYCDTYGMSVTCLRFSNVYGPHIDCLRKQPPFIAYMIRELYFDRTPVFHSDGEQRRDYIYVDDLIKLAVKVQFGEGFDVVNASSNNNYSVNEMYNIAKRIMKKNIQAVYAPDDHYWANYQELFEGRYPIKNEILNHEINKYSLCDNDYAKKKYGWIPEIGIEEGLQRVVDNECVLLENISKGN